MVKLLNIDFNRRQRFDSLFEPEIIKSEEGLISAFANLYSEFAEAIFAITMFAQATFAETLFLKLHLQ